jgi:endoglucanase
MRNLFYVFCLFITFTSFGQLPPIETNGSNIIDFNRKPILFKGINWWGANGSLIPYSDNHSKNTNTHAMPFGLHVQHLDTILQAIKTIGFNSIRLPFSNQMLHDTTKSLKDWVGPNKNLIGLTPLQVMDTILEHCANHKLMVVLNNHSTTTHWCCNYDFNGLWNGGDQNFKQKNKAWIDDWRMLALRYKSNLWVVGADLRNEVRPKRRRGIPLPVNPNWGKGGKNDWKKQAQKAAEEIHKNNSNWLIIVEGINARVDLLMNLHFPHLKPIHKKPIQLSFSNKLIYEVHNYPFNWIKGNIIRRKKMVTYGEINSKNRLEEYEKNWGYVHKTQVAPVIVGEFGCSKLDHDRESWLNDLTSYIHQNNISFFWWTLEEELENASSYGLMNEKMNEMDVQLDWRWKYLEKLLGEY